MFRAVINYRGNSSTTFGGKIFATLFGLVFAGFGVLFCVLIFRDASAGLQTWRWTETPCTITASDVIRQNIGKRDGDEFAFAVKYTYTAKGREIVSQQYQLQPASSDDYARMARLSERYAVGAKTICYVNSNSPDTAVLARYNLWTLFLFLFPLPFMGFGALVAYSVWQSPSSRPSSLSAQAVPAKNKSAGIVKCSFFLLIGGVALYFLFLHPMSKVIVARSWPAVPCNIISNAVKSHSGSKGTTYSINIFYSYDFNGHPHKSNAYDFMSGSSSGYAGKQAVVSQYPSGTKAICYVNPNDPTEAVLMRGQSSMMWFALIPLVFVAIGGGGLIAVLRQRSGNPASAGSPASSPTTTSPTPETLVFKPSAAPWKMFIGAIFVCLLLNGLIVLFAFKWRPLDAFILLPLITFGCFGLISYGSVIYYFLALFDPRPHLTIQPGAVALGDSLHVQWTLTGNVSRLKNLQLRLTGREEATKGHGKNAVTATSYFANLEIANTALQREMQRGEACLTLPVHLVPSFDAPSNKIIWTIYVLGEIPRWPDVKQEFPITILPAQPAAAQSI
jgi:Protein of unknown function (DUF3592)